MSSAQQELERVRQVLDTAGAPNPELSPSQRIRLMQGEALEDIQRTGDQIRGNEPALSQGASQPFEYGTPAGTPQNPEVKAAIEREGFVEGYARAENQVAPKEGQGAVRPDLVLENETNQDPAVKQPMKMFPTGGASDQPANMSSDPVADGTPKGSTANPDDQRTTTAGKAGKKSKVAPARARKDTSTTETK